MDALLVGGAMAYTFLKAQGRKVGKSLVENDKIELAKELLQAAEEKKVQLLLPVDNVTAEKIDAAATTQVAKTEQGIPDAQMGLDIGPATIAAFSKEIARARTIVWNGPMGVFEVAPFARGTMKVAEAGGGKSQCHINRWRRRLGSGGASVRTGGQDFTHLHRRRRVTGVSGRQEAAGRGSANQ